MDAFEQSLEDLVDIPIPNGSLTGVEYEITADEQRNIMRLARCFFRGDRDEPATVARVFSLMTQLLTNPRRSPLVVELLQPTSDFGKVFLIRRFGQYLPNAVMIALVNLVQVVGGRLRIDVKAVNNMTFEKDIRASMTHIEGFQAVVSNYLKQLNKSPVAPVMPSFADHKQVIIDVLDKSVVLPQSGIQIVPVVNVSSDLIHDKNVINPLRKIISDTFIKAAFFNEINQGSENKIFNTFARFILK